MDNWKSIIKAPYSEVKELFNECLHAQCLVEDALGDKYLAHPFVDGVITCPITGKHPNIVFNDPDRWGTFNACEHCSPELWEKGYKCEETKEIAPIEHPAEADKGEILNALAHLVFEVEQQGFKKLYHLAYAQYVIKKHQK